VIQHVRIVWDLLKLNAPLATQQEPFSQIILLVWIHALMDILTTPISTNVRNVIIPVGNVPQILLLPALNVLHLNSFIMVNA
jgi:hypothetical protein